MINYQTEATEGWESWVHGLRGNSASQYPGRTSDGRAHHVWSQQRETDECWHSTSFLLSIQSSRMVPPTFRVALPSSDQPFWKSSLTITPGCMTSNGFKSGHLGKSYHRNNTKSLIYIYFTFNPLMKEKERGRESSYVHMSAGFLLEGQKMIL